MSFRVYSGIFGAICIGALATTPKSAQAASSKFALSGVGITQTGESGNLDLDSDFSNTSPTSATVTNQQFTGMDSVGATRTLTFSGQNNASADFGSIHLYAQGSVSNNYYNAANAHADQGGVFHPEGSPDGCYSLGFGGFDDSITFSGALAGYTARYVLHAEGTNTGYGGLADLGVGVDGNPDESFFAFDDGFQSVDWITQSYPINGMTPQLLHVQFSNQFNMNCYDFGDGDNVEGSSDFTLTLARIEVLDSHGDPVSGIMASSDSGTVYSVPEPSAAFGAIATIATLIKRRVRRK